MTVASASLAVSWPPAPIGLLDLEFSRVPVQQLSTAGTPFIRWANAGMPRIPQKVLDSVVYLYSNAEDAQQGKHFGGTGFIVSYPSPMFPKHLESIYVVSNWHVTCRDGCSVVRLNTLGGQSDILEFGPEDWVFDPKFDISVLPIPVNPDVHRFSHLPKEALITEELVQQVKIGPGDDVFMIGRFIDHDGGQTNQPSVRFGNISVMPSPIKQSNGQYADSFCIDLHSRAGYSGSPVFIYRTPGYDLEQMLDPKDQRILLAGTNLFALLGIHWGQFPEMWEIRDGISEKSAQEGSLITEGKYVKGLSGMTCVLPSWAINDVLNHPKLQELRRKIDLLWERKFQQGGHPPEVENPKASS